MLKQNKALLIVDLQNDFCTNGSLAIPRAEEIIAPINELIPKYVLSVASQDWHPKKHVSYASSHPGEKEFSIINIDGIQQNLWPDHCEENTFGASFHKDFNSDACDLVLRKGNDVNLDSYSVFFANDNETSTGLHSCLQEYYINELDICGLAYDFCVYFSAMDAYKLGYKVNVFKNLSRAVDFPIGTAAARTTEMLSTGISILS